MHIRPQQKEEVVSAKVLVEQAVSLNPSLPIVFRCLERILRDRMMQSVRFLLDTSMVNAKRRTIVVLPCCCGDCRLLFVCVCVCAVMVGVCEKGAAPPLLLFSSVLLLEKRWVKETIITVSWSVEKFLPLGCHL